jgi:hypothetical protein
MKIFSVFVVMGLSTNFLVGMDPGTDRAIAIQLAAYDAFVGSCYAFYKSRIHDSTSGYDTVTNDEECMKAITEEATRLHNKRANLIGFDSVDPGIEVGPNYCRMDLQKQNLDSIHTFYVNEGFAPEVTHLNLADNSLHMLRLHFIVSQCKNLQTLNVEDNSIKTIIGDDPTVIVSNRPTESNLALICLNRNNLTAKGLMPLISKNFPKLKEIHVKQNPTFFNRDLRALNGVIKEKLAQCKFVEGITTTEQQNQDTITTTYSAAAKSLLKIVASK